MTILALSTAAVLTAAAAFTQTLEKSEAFSLAPTLIASDANQSTLPVPQDPDATIDKAKPADEMLGETAPNGTTLDVDTDAATVDGVPRDAETGYVNTDTKEASVGIPDSE